MRRNLIDSLAVRFIRNEPGPVSRYISVSETGREFHLPHPSQATRYHVLCKISCDCVVGDGGETEARQRAASLMIHHLYGDIKSDLIEIAVQMRADGHDQTSVSFQLLAQLIDELEIKI